MHLNINTDIFFVVHEESPVTLQFDNSICVLDKTIIMYLGHNIIIHAAPIGGHCNVPDECICRNGYSGANCTIRK